MVKNRTHNVTQSVTQREQDCTLNIIRNIKSKVGRDRKRTNSLSCLNSHSIFKGKGPCDGLIEQLPILFFISSFWVDHSLYVKVFYTAHRLPYAPLAQPTHRSAMESQPENPFALYCIGSDTFMGCFIIHNHWR